MNSVKASVTSALLLAILALVTLSYLPGASGPYVLDDEINVTRNNAIAITSLDASSLATAAISSPSSPLRRPLASLTFALNYYFAGSFEPTTPFKLTNLVIHLLNVVLVYFFARLLARLLSEDAERSTLPEYAGLLCAAVWGLHPINANAVLYVVQRMTSLAAMFELGGLLAFTYGRAILGENKKRALIMMYGGVVAGTALGLTAKETSALTPLMALALEVTIFRARRPPEHCRAALLTFYALVLLLPAVVVAIYVFQHPNFILRAYIARPFSLIERLLTETRVLWYYVRLIVVPDVREFGLFHDDIAISTGIFSPPTTLASVVGLVAALAVSLRARQFPAVAFATAWFIAGHLLESSIIGLERAYEHRNYVPSLGIVFALAYGLVRYGARRQRAIAEATLAITIVVVVALALQVVVQRWTNVDTLAIETVRHHAESARNNDFAATVSLNNGDLAVAGRFAARAASLLPTETGYRIKLYMIVALANARGQPLGEELGSCRTPTHEQLKNSVCSLLIAERIEDDLRRQPISAIGHGALDNVRECVMAIDGCANLGPTARRWFVAAFENGNVSRRMRENLAFEVALLNASAGDYVSALSYLRRAAALAPDKVAYRVGEAQFLIELDRRREAREVLDELAHADHYPHHELALNESIVTKLRELLQAK